MRDSTCLCVSLVVVARLSELTHIYTHSLARQLAGTVAASRSLCELPARRLASGSRRERSRAAATTFITLMNSELHFCFALCAPSSGLTLRTAPANLGPVRVSLGLSEPSWRPRAASVSFSRRLGRPAAPVAGAGRKKCARVGASSSFLNIRAKKKPPPEQANQLIQSAASELCRARRALGNNSGG